MDKVTLTMSELLGFGNKCWWQSKKYWENHPDGEAEAKTINQIFEEFMEKKTKHQRMEEFERDGPMELQSSIMAPENHATDQFVNYKKLYNELIGAVVRKFPGESRHETALRYITEAEDLTGEANADNDVSS